MSKTPESILKDEVIAYLKKAQIFHRRMNSGKVKVRGGFMQLCPTGTADILAFIGSDPYWLELKGKGQVTQKAQKEAQAAFAEEVRAMGHRYARCESVEDVVAALNGVVVKEAA